MLFRNVKQFVFFILFIFSVQPLFAQNKPDEKENQLLQQSIDLLKYYFFNNKKSWHISRPETANDVKELIDFIENEPIDTVLKNLDKSFNDSLIYVFRLPENVEDSLNVRGYIPGTFVKQKIDNLKCSLQKKINKNSVKIPSSILTDLDKKLNLIPNGKGMVLFIDSVYRMPDSLQIPEVIPDSLLTSPAEFNRLVRIDSIRTAYVEEKRMQYNDSLVAAYVDSVRDNYVQQKYNEELHRQVKYLKDSVKVNNYNVLKAYNEKVVKQVNDSILLILTTLSDYARYIDSTNVAFVNLTGQKSDLVLKNGDERFYRIWLKNVQNDSLSVMVKSTDNRTMYMVIDDGATISRYKPKATREFDFSTLVKKETTITKFGDTYNVETPWTIGGNGNVGFSQTYLENWKKGGQSAVSLLLVLKGFANYSAKGGKISWNNTGEIRNGWIRFGAKGSEIQKNDDKIEFTSRYSISAFKKWFYGIEFNYETQLFKGYKYPRQKNPKPISAFMAPVRTFFKLGMVYKPKNNFSLMLSPLTLKNVYVRDTSLVNQTNFGIAKDRKSFWNPGANADLNWRYKISDNIIYSTRYKMFINYKKPFKKFDIDWENLVEVPLTDFINLRFQLHFIYDDDVLFPVYDDNNVKISEKPKLQTKEFLFVGFTYRINHKVLRASRIR